MTPLHTTGRAWKSIRVNPKWIEAPYTISYVTQNRELLDAEAPRYATPADARNGVPVPKHEITWEDGSVTYA